jgi:choice-of-anchor A domain-containing protein
MISSRRYWLLLAMAGSFCVGISGACADLLQVLPEMNDLQRWGVFSLGNSFFSDHFAGHAYINGDVGVAGAGRIKIAGNAITDGNLYYRSSGILKVSGNGTITGGSFSSEDPELDNGVNEAIASSYNAFALTPTSSHTKINLSRNQSKTITGGPGETVVLKLGHFLLRGHAVLTLQGTATTNFIINVKHQFSLTGNAAIVLSGDVQLNNVLFNVRRSGDDVTLGGHSSLEGILMANKRTVRVIRHSTVTGAVIANRVQLRGGSQVIQPPLVSP